MSTTSVIQIPLRISNAFLIKGERPLLIDTGSPKDAELLLRRLKKHDVEAANLSLILHTHGHEDHCGSTAGLKVFSSAPAAIHILDAFMSQQGRNGPVKPVSFMARILSPFVDQTFPPFKPDICITEEMSLREYGVDGRVIFTPGHTAGSISVVLGTGEAIVGDTLMGGFLGGAICRSRPGYPYVADNLDEIRKSVEKLLALSPSKVFVGHGGPLSPKQIEVWLKRTAQ